MQLLLARADPRKPCAALGLLPGQHAVLQVPRPQCAPACFGLHVERPCSRALHARWTSQQGPNAPQLR